MKTQRSQINKTKIIKSICHAKKKKGGVAPPQENTTNNKRKNLLKEIARYDGYDSISRQEH